MNLVQLIELLVAISGTGLASGLFARYKSEAEKKKAQRELDARMEKYEIDTADKINQMASRLADDQREQIKLQNKEIEILKAEYREIKAENEELKVALEALEKCNETYRRQSERRKVENMALREEIDQLDKSVRGLS